MQFLSKSWLYSSLFSILALSFYPFTAFAQTENVPEQFAFITIDLWPDYDRPEVLIIINGSLSPDTPLPATVTLPLPSDASINAVARVDSHGLLVDDFEYTVNNDEVTFSISDLAFRVEYYQPYESTADNKSIEFEWAAPQPIEQFLITVQQPAEATNFTLSQEILQVQRNSDGLLYHILPTQTLLADQEATLNVSYTMPQTILSVDTLVAPEAVTADAPAAAIDNTTWWLYGLGGIMLIFSIVMIGWGVKDQVQASRLSKPKRQRGVYCSNCGQIVGKSDKFCGNCGTAL